MESITETIANEIIAYKQDHSQVIITKELIREIVEENISDIVDEIENLIGELQ